MFYPAARSIRRGLPRWQDGGVAKRQAALGEFPMSLGDLAATFGDMWLTFVPVLGALRRLYDMPRDETRFNAYTGMIGQGGPDGLVPLSAFNPMAREHVAEALDALIALEAEHIAADAVREAGPRLRGLPAEWGTELRLMVVLSDDLGGMWTHRPTSELQIRTEQRALLSRRWIAPVFWTSDTPTAEGVRATTLAAIYRALFHIALGPPRSAGRVLEQERLALAFAGAAVPLPEVEEAALRAAITPWLNARDDGTRLAVLLGDEAAVALGYDARGVPPRGGLRLAAAEAAQERDPLKVLLAG